MAILKSLPGVEVKIRSNGAELEEYVDKEDNVKRSWRHKTVSNYVQSTAHAGFSFQLKVNPPYEHDCYPLGFFFVLNGYNDGPGQLCEPTNLDQDRYWEKEIRGFEVPGARGAKLRKFKFIDLQITDDESGKRSKKNIAKMKNVGLIEVRVFQMAEGRAEELKQNKLNDALTKVPEKIIKGRAISHSISYNDEEAIPQASEFLAYKFIHDWNNPIGVFRFKYRSRADLQKHMIIPRTPSPVPPAPRGIEALTPDEKRRLARMKYEDAEMLRAMTAPAAAGATTPCVPQFEDLGDEEIDCLARRKHAEMTGRPGIKGDLAVKIETRQESHARASTMANNPDGE